MCLIQWHKTQKPSLNFSFETNVCKSFKTIWNFTVNQRRDWNVKPWLIKYFPVNQIIKDFCTSKFYSLIKWHKIFKNILWDLFWASMSSLCFWFLWLKMEVRHSPVVELVQCDAISMTGPLLKVKALTNISVFLVGTHVYLVTFYKDVENKTSRQMVNPN